MKLCIASSLALASISLCYAFTLRVNTVSVPSSSTSLKLGISTFSQKRKCFSLVQRRNAMIMKESSNDFDDMVSGPAQVAAGGINVSGEAPFEIRGFSLGNAFLIGGVAITTASFAEYFTSSGAGLSGLGFVYGIPVALIGLALKYAELPPVGVQSSPEASALFEVKATDTMRKIKKDVTRHRYGDEAHLDSTVKALGLVLPQSDYPQLKGLREEISPNGDLVFSMIFSSKATPFKMWIDEARIKKYNAFFGPGIEASVEKISSEERLVAIKLTTVNPEASSKSESEATLVEEKSVN